MKFTRLEAKNYLRGGLERAWRRTATQAQPAVVAKSEAVADRTVPKREREKLTLVQVSHQLCQPVWCD
jgi:hypothetical protein